MNIAELRQDRTIRVTEMRGLVDAADREKRDLAAHEDRRFGELKGEISSLDRQIARAEALADVERSAPAVLKHRGDGRYEDRANEFSIIRAVRAALGEDVDAGFEREISGEVRKRSGRSFEGIAIPDEVFVAPARELRTMLTSDAAAPLMPNVHRADLFVDRLRAALVTGRLGATVLDNLVGDVDVPRQTASATGQWVAEDGEIATSDLDFDDVQLRPKSVGAITSYSRRTLINASPSIEQIVRNDLAAQIANAIDEAALIGSGTANQPRGIAATLGVAAVDMGTGPTWADVLDMIAAVETADAFGAALGWAMNGYAVKKLRSTLKEPGDVAGGFLMDAVGQLAGYPVATTSALPPERTAPAGPATLIFGDYSSLLVGYWTGTDLLINPYADSAYSRGRVLMRAMRDVDVAVRHPESFAVSIQMPVT